MTDKIPSAASYTVGYGKPPQKNKFQKGTSGNSRGRPKKKLRIEDRLDKVLDFNRMFGAELASKVTIIENGKKVQISAMQAIVMTLIRRAIKGEDSATNRVLDFLKKTPKEALLDDSTITYRISKESLDALQAFMDETEDFAPVEGASLNSGASSTGKYADLVKNASSN